MNPTAVMRKRNWLYRFYMWFVCRIFRIEDENDKPDFVEKAAGGFLLAWIVLVASIVVIGVTESVWESIQFSRLSPAEHLAQAKSSCSGLNDYCTAPEEAIRHLEAIPTSASESKDAVQLLSEARAQIKSDAANHEQRAREQMQRNFAGTANDPFNCAMSTENQPIVSFDGKTWWRDDGRCAVRLQKKRDEEAQLSSYRSHSLRVDTDMNASWLPDEERTCQTYPDSNGKVSTVRCTQNEGATHNIPVEFWGGVERNTVSDWKCRREKSVLDDHFVCKAID
jgi:hypothetical protein